LDNRAVTRFKSHKVKASKAKTSDLVTFWPFEKKGEIMKADSLIDVPRDDIVMMLEAGYIYLAMGKFSEAKQVFEGIISLAPGHEVPRVALANVYFAQKKYLQAIRSLKEALEINSQSAFAYSHLGEALLFNGKKDEALKALAQADKIEPTGKAGDFARSLSKLISMGYDPVRLRSEQSGKAGASR